MNLEKWKKVKKIKFTNRQRGFATPLLEVFLKFWRAVRSLPTSYPQLYATTT